MAAFKAIMFTGYLEEWVEKECTGLTQDAFVDAEILRHPNKLILKLVNSDKDLFKMRLLLTAVLVLSAVVVSIEAQYPPPPARRNLSMPTFRVASIIAPPFLQKKSDDANVFGGNEQFEGFIKDVLDELARLLNFKYRILLSDDGQYGSEDPATGKWSGLVGMVQKNRADFVAADLTVTAKRHDTLDFSRPFMTAPVTIVTQKSSSLFGGGMFDFFVPFTWDLWLLLGLAFLITALVLFLIARISPYEQWSEVYPVFNLSNSFWFTFSCFFRGSGYTPKTVSTRLLTAGWYLFGLSVLVVYAIGLNGFIRAEFSGTQFLVASINSLLTGSSVQIGLIQGGSTHSMLENSEIDVHRALYERVLEDPETNFVGSYVEGIKKVLEGDGSFALIMEGNAADYFKAQHCDLYSIGSLTHKQYALGFPIGSRYRSILSNGLLRLRESGRLQQLVSKWWASTANCAVEEAKQLAGAGTCQEVALSLNLGNLAWPFIIWAILLVVAVLIALIELFIHVAKHPTTEKNGARIVRQLKYAFCGCCVKSASLAPNECLKTRNQSSQT